MEVVEIREPACCEACSVKARPSQKHRFCVKPSKKAMLALAERRGEIFKSGTGWDVEYRVLVPTR